MSAASAASDPNPAPEDQLAVCDRCGAAHSWRPLTPDSIAKCSRCEAVLRARSRGWPESKAGEMERHYSPGRTWEATARALFGLLRLGRVLDIGCGDGTMAELLAPRAEAYVGVDHSDKMILAGRERLTRFENVRLVVGDMHALDFGANEFDEVLLLNVLTYSPAPARALSRRLSPSGVSGVSPVRAVMRRRIGSPADAVKVHGDPPPPASFPFSTVREIR